MSSFLALIPMTNQQLSDKANIKQAELSNQTQASQSASKQARKPCKSSSPAIGCSRTGGPTYRPKSSNHSANKLTSKPSSKQADNQASKPSTSNDREASLLDNQVKQAKVNQQSPAATCRQLPMTCGRSRRTV